MAQGNTVITVLISVAALVFLKPLMRVLNVPETIFEEAYDYIVVIVAGMIATIWKRKCRRWWIRLNSISE